MPTLRATLVVASLLVLRAAAAWDGVATLNPDLPVDFAPYAISTPDAHGLWSIGAEAGRTLLVRYDATGGFQYVRYVPSAEGALLADVRAMPDGGALVLNVEGYPDNYCKLRRFDVSGNLRWVGDALHSSLPTYTSNPCPPLTTDGGGIWLQQRGATALTRLSADGAVQTTAEPDDLAVEDFLGDPAGNAVYVIGAVGGYDTGLATVEKFDDHGVLQWRVQAPPGSGASDFLAADADESGIYVFGKFIRDSVQQDTLYGMHVSRDGKLLAQWTDTGIFTRTIDSVKIAGDGKALVLFESSDAASDGAQLVAKTGAAGTFAWRTTLRPSECYRHVVHSAPNGDAIVADASCPDPNKPNQSAGELFRFAPDGSRVADVRYVGSSADDTQVLADSSTVALVRVDPPPGVLPAPTLERRARDGSLLPAPQTAGVVHGLNGAAGAVVAPDGSAYVLDIAADASRFAFSRIAPDGLLAWTQQGSGSWTGDPKHPRIVLTAGAACLIGRHNGAQAAECHVAATGAAQAAFTFSSDVENRVSDTAASVLGDGRILVWHTAGDGKMHETVITANGNILSAAAPLSPGEYRIALSTNSAGLSLIATGESNYAEVDANGHRLFTQPGSGLGGILQTYLLDDGSGLLLSETGGTTQLSRTDTLGHGTVSWTKAVPPPPGHAPQYDQLSAVVIDGSDAYLVFGYDAPVVMVNDLPLPTYAYLVERVALGNGSVKWSRVVEGTRFHLPLAQLDRATRRLAVVAASPGKLRTQVIDADTGAVVDDSVDACGASDCTLLAAGFGGDGALRAAANATDVANGSSKLVFRRNGPLGAVPTIRVDQAGLDGAWYAPYASGQGFSIDFIGAAKTLFMPWFTYTTDGGNTPSGLAWYALQGNVDPGAKAIDLTITAPLPGVFAGGAVDVSAVGSAHVSFSDCNSGSLSYRFNADVNGGATGLISLTRLTPSSSPCTLADGSIAAAQSQAAPAQGFDANQSGSWYDPATPGQGIQLTVLPPGGGSTGLLFASWFTFDPTGAADEPTHQHWFTLQGDLAAATDGKVSLPILRTIGGRFDAQPTGNTVQVGTATLKFTACDAAELDYRFDTTGVAHTFAGLGGTVHLVRIGGCATP